MRVEFERAWLRVHERIAAVLGNSTLAIVEATGHLPFIEAPDRYLGEVCTWLDHVAPRPGQR